MRAIALPGIEDPIALAVDWLADHLYIVDQETNKIDLVSIDGKHRKNVLSYVADPTDIVIDPNVG